MVYVFSFESEGCAKNLEIYADIFSQNIIIYKSVGSAYYSALIEICKPLSQDLFFFLKLIEKVLWHLVLFFTASTLRILYHKQKKSNLPEHYSNNLLKFLDTKASFESIDSSDKQLIGTTQCSDFVGRFLAVPWKYYLHVNDHIWQIVKYI